jgi:hypothetical protein
MTLIRNKKLVDLTFITWISQFPDSGYPGDMERFYIFAKTVCESQTKKWRNAVYIKKRILEKMPHFDPKVLGDILDLFNKLLAFYKTSSLPDWESISPKDYREVKLGYFIERYIEEGEIKERELPISDVL